MSQGSKHPGLAWCLGVACLGALLAMAMQAVLLPLAGWWAMSVVAVVLPVAYLMWLLAMAPARAGRFVLGVVVLVLAVIEFVWPLSLTMILLVQGAMVWLVRSVSFHRSLLGALIDGAVVFVGAGAAGAAFISTRNVTTSVWTGLLVQAAFVYIPDEWGRRASPGVTPDNFQRAAQTAEAALRELAARS